MKFTLFQECLNKAMNCFENVSINEVVIKNLLCHLVSQYKEAKQSPGKIMNSCVIEICELLNEKYGLKLDIVKHMCENYFEMCCEDEFNENDRLQLLFLAMQDKYEFIFRTVNNTIHEQPYFIRNANNYENIKIFIEKNYDGENNNFKIALMTHIRNIIIKDRIVYHLERDEFKKFDYHYFKNIEDNLYSYDYFVITRSGDEYIYENIKLVYENFTKFKYYEILNFIRQKLREINIFNYEIKELNEKIIYSFFSSNIYSNFTLEELKPKITKHVMYFTLIEFFNHLCVKNNITSTFSTFLFFQVLQEHSNREYLNNEILCEIELRVIESLNHCNDIFC